MFGQSFEWPPSTEYATNVQGAPMNPIKEVFPSVSFLRVCYEGKYRLITDGKNESNGHVNEKNIALPVKWVRGKGLAEPHHA